MCWLNFPRFFFWKVPKNDDRNRALDCRVSIYIEEAESFNRSVTRWQSKVMLIAVHAPHGPRHLVSPILVIHVGRNARRPARLRGGGGGGGGGSGGSGSIHSFFFSRNTSWLMAMNHMSKQSIFLRIHEEYMRCGVWSAACRAPFA